MIRWPLREALRGYRRHVQAMELDDYRHRLLCWSMVVPWLPKRERKPPAPPSWMKDSRRGDA